MVFLQNAGKCTRVSLEFVGDGGWLLRFLLPLIQSVVAWMAEAMVNIQRVMLQIPFNLM